MTLLDKLPVVNKCCFCVNLKLGSIIIAIWGISIRVSADILICTVILKCLVSIGYTVIMMIQEQYTHCRWYYSQIFHLIRRDNILLLNILAIYFKILCDFVNHLNLKIGSILIAICGLLSLGSIATIVVKPICGTATGLFPDLLKYFGYVSIAVNILLMVFSLIFLIASCLDRFSISATLFLICILLFLIINLVTIILVIVAIIMDSNCRQELPMHALVIVFPIWIYFMIVVRSYKDEME